MTLNLVVFVSKSQGFVSSSSTRTFLSSICSCKQTSSSPNGTLLDIPLLYNVLLDLEVDRLLDISHSAQPAPSTCQPTESAVDKLSSGSGDSNVDDHSPLLFVTNSPHRYW
ncbi:hypothetical protein GEMRC1_006086 [Eukaryota sp. GEM-RC1]